MNQAFHLVKIVASVAFVVAGTVCVFVNFPLALTLFVGGLAWSKIPE